MIFFKVVRKGWRNVFFCSATDREDAKIQARSHLMGNPDEYEVTPLTEKGDRLHISTPFC